MEVQQFAEMLQSDFYTGVPDSQLRALCDYLMEKYGINRHHHLIAANEGNCVALAAGYHLATGKIPVVYMQNSGEGNIINPVTSLLSKEVYAIPMIFVVGWRGEPGVRDEPQHIFQGKVTLKLLDDMDIVYYVVDKGTSGEDIRQIMSQYVHRLKEGRSVAFVIKKGALTYDSSIMYKNGNLMLREKVIEHIVEVSGEDPIVSTTGKASRELYETRLKKEQSNKYDFLTVGSMGHASSIALGIAINKPQIKVWCIDGDGAALMHMGALGVIGAVQPSNLIYILINNGAHETVGGMPTVAEKINWPTLAQAVGFQYVSSVDNYKDLDVELDRVKNTSCLCMIEVKCSIQSRSDLGRPVTTSLENKENFMEYLKQI